MIECSRFPTRSLPSSKFNYGVGDEYLKNLLSYWRDEYDWKKQEAILNDFQHFKTNIEGLNIHFIYQKPAAYPSNVEVIALAPTYSENIRRFRVSTSKVTKVTKNMRYCDAYPKKLLGFGDALYFSLQMH